MRQAALITGGAKRIGKEISIFLATLGYDIALHYFSSKTEANKTAFLIKKLRVNCEIFDADLGNEEDVLNLIPRVASKFKNLSILINSASIYERSSIQETSPELFAGHIITNLAAPFFLSKEFAATCKKGQIINILDTRIISNSSKYAAYSLSKKALAEFTKMAAFEFAPKIRVNGIAPGLILPPKGKDINYLDRLAKNIPLRKRGSVENIKTSVKFLIENDYVTGQIIFCDGGQHLIF